MNKRKYVHSFELDFIRRTCYGDVYRAACYEGGHWITIESLFLDYPRRLIRQLMRAALLKKLNGGRA